MAERLLASSDLNSEYLDVSQTWHDAALAIQLAQVIQRAGASQLPSFYIKVTNHEVADHWLSKLKKVILPDRWRKIPASIEFDRLIGGLDLSATLATGRREVANGLVVDANGGMLVLNAVECHSEDILSKLMQIHDSGFVQVEDDPSSNHIEISFGMVVFDTSEEEPTNVMEALADRCMFHIDLRSFNQRSVARTEMAVQEQLRPVICASEDIEKLARIAMSLGLTSLRPSQQALRIAIANAQLFGRKKIEPEDLEVAFRLALLNRTKILPNFDESEEEAEASSEPHEPASDEDQSREESSNTDQLPPENMEVEAMLANLPPDLLANILRERGDRRPKRSAGQSGSRQVSFERGRALSSVRAKPGRGRRLDIIATLRSAAPWQGYRRKISADRLSKTVLIRTDDFHVKRYRKKSETSVIFVVDASGSTALNRLGEAKGAVELLLAEGYARRDHVSLIRMSGKTSDVMLPPTRSLVLAKRCLAGLVGGGGTPLAHGLAAAQCVAEDEARKGRSVSIVLLTDGSANIALDQTANRAQAGEDALTVARTMSSCAASLLVLDVSRRPSSQAEEIANAACGHYLAMPFASAGNISSAVSATTNLSVG